MCGYPLVITDELTLAVAMGKREKQLSLSYQVNDLLKIELTVFVITSGMIKRFLMMRYIIVYVVCVYVLNYCRI